MAKKKDYKDFPNLIRVNDRLLKLNARFIGVNGRFGQTNKLWKDFSLDEIIEFARCHNNKTVNHHLIGAVPPNYVGPWDKAELPVKPNKEENPE